MSFVDILLYVILPLVVAGYFYVKKKFSYFEEQGIPHFKPSFPLGNMSGVGKTIHALDLLEKLYTEFRGKDVITGIFTFTSPTVIVLDLELVKNITVRDFNNFVDRGVFVNEDDEPITGHLFGIGGEKWRFLRNKLSPTFTSGKIKMMYNQISDKGNNFISAIEKESKFGSVDMKNISNRFTIDVVSSCVFGMEANTLKNEHPEVVEIFNEIFTKGPGSLHFFMLFAFPNLSKKLQLRQFNKKVTNFFYDVIGSSIRQREAGNIERNDFLNSLIQLKNKGSIDGEISTESRKLTFDEVISQAFIFFFAGADTTSTVIAYAITELGHHPEIQERLRKEILEKTKTSNGEITYDNLHEMTYLSQVVNETLRKFPPASITARQAAEDYQIPGSKHVIKKGILVMIPNTIIHYDDRYWKNPQEFNPDRFTDKESAGRPNLAFMPFGEGPRNCIGMRFALVNLKFAVATIIKNFKVELDSSKTKLPLKFDPKNPGLAPLGGFWTKFQKI